MAFLMYADGDMLDEMGLDEMDDRVKLVDMLDGASDAASLAIPVSYTHLTLPTKA